MPIEICLGTISSLSLQIDNSRCVFLSAMVLVFTSEICLILYKFHLLIQFMSMKKIFTLSAMMVMLAFSSQAAYYLVGEAPFGNGWDPSNGLEMTLGSDGLYSVKGTVNGTIYFVLADNLSAPGDWTTFNNEYRIGPLGANEEVTVGSWITTQKAAGNGNGSYKFTGTGSEYTITYNPYISKFKIEGEVIPITIDTYTVAGTPESVFGTLWDPNNENNNMVKQDDGTFKLNKYGCQLSGDELQFKVVGNHDWGFAWPDNDFIFSVDEPGTYDVTFTFNPETKEVGVTAEMTGSFDPRTGELYVLGEVVEAAGWNPSEGLKMDTEDGNIFTTTFTSMGNNPDENDGIGYSYFQFTTKLSESSDDWNSINAYRIGAIENDYLLSDDLMGIEIQMGNFGQANSFKIPAGKFDVTVDLENKTMVINKNDTPEPPAGPQLEKVWEITDLSSFYLTGVRQGFGMGGKFYINDTQWNAENGGEPTIYVVGENGVEATLPGSANTPITRDEAGNIIVTNNVAFPSTDWAAAEATIKVINPETRDIKEYAIPEDCMIAGRCDMIGFAKGNLMEDGVLYFVGGNSTGVSVLTIAGGEVSTDDCYIASCDGLVPSTSTVINHYKDLAGEDGLLYVTRNAAPTKLFADGDNFIGTTFTLPNKGACNGAFPFIWEGTEYFVYPTLPNYLDGFAIAEANAEEPLVEVPATAAANANSYTSNWLNAEVDKDGVNIYQYYPGGHLTVYRLTNGTGGVEEIINNVEKVVAGVRYYNIMGQEMKEANGITIVVTTYTDGSHSAVKVIK